MPHSLDASLNMAPMPTGGSALLVYDQDEPMGGTEAVVLKGGRIIQAKMGVHHGRRDRSMLRQNDGQREVLEQLFSRCRVRLYNKAFRMLGNREDAEDALQDGLLAAFRNLNGFEGRSQLSTWLTRIVINAALMRRRQCRPTRTVSIDQNLMQDDQALAGNFPDPNPNPEERYVYQEQLQLVERVLRALPEVHRRVWWLCHVQGLKIREVAAIMGISSGTLKSRLFRVRRRLREQAGESWYTSQVLPAGNCGGVSERINQDR